MSKTNKELEDYLSRRKESGFTDDKLTPLEIFVLEVVEVGGDPGGSYADAEDEFAAIQKVKQLLADNTATVLTRLTDEAKTYSQVTYDFGTALVVGEVTAVPTSVIEAELNALTQTKVEYQKATHD